VEPQDQERESASVEHVEPVEAAGRADGADGAAAEVEEVAAAPEAPRNPNRHWYAIHTYSGYENKVRTHLEARIESMHLKDLIYQVVVPMENEIEVKNGTRRTVARKVYPGYVLVDMVLTAETWHAVRNTPGVTGFVGAQNEPAPLSDADLPYIIRAPLKGEGAEEKAKPRIAYTIGQSVKVIGGPFADFIGTVSEVDGDKQKVTVLVSFFGRDTPVQLDFLQVEKM
jgi:transcription termination/antitermination protein NusG